MDENSDDVNLDFTRDRLAKYDKSTVYWNINAPEIAEEIDDLISKIAHQS